MKPAILAALFGALLLNCATSGPIDRFVSAPPKEAGKPDVCLHLPPDASPGQVVKKMLGPDSRSKVLEVRRVSFSRRVSPYAVLVEIEGLGQRIMVVGYVGKDRGGWWCYTYETD
jgi:hypothetical protein